MITMQCHYETLEVAKDAGDDEIKKSYRKLALQFHPDKNPDRIEESTKQFRIVQQAYDVLSDPQERAWYDKHREAILKGGLGQGDKYSDKCLDVYKYFNTSCFTGFSDDQLGFYSVFRDVFKAISEEDREYVTLKEGQDFIIPEFGTSNSSYEEVVGPFYGGWESYCTSKSYVWMEKYDTREAPNRQVRRLMEQDNKKLRDKARKDRNEEVRELVAFVRKRDKRLTIYKKKLEDRAIEIARLAEEKKQRDREHRQTKLKDYTESEWSSMSCLEDQLQALESQFGDDSSSDEEEGPVAGEPVALDDLVEESYQDEYLDLYCVACNKAFKSEKALANHSKSKKHAENVLLLREEMIEDDARMGNGQAEDGHDGGGATVLNDTSNVRSGRATTEDGELGDDDEEDVLEESAGEEEVVDSREVYNPTNKSKSKKQKKKRRMLQKLLNPDPEEEDGKEKDVTIDKQSIQSFERDATQMQDDSRLKPDITGDSQENSVSPDATSGASLAPEQTVKNDNPEDVKGKTKKLSEEKSNSRPSNDSCTSWACNKCSKVYPTRNKLFDHIKQTGHALRVDFDNEIVNEGGATESKKTSKKSAKEKKNSKR